MEVTLVIILIAVIGVAVFSHYLQKKKHEENQRLAATRGYRYHQSYPSLAKQVVAAVDGGHESRRFTMVFEGEKEGLHFLAGTAQWTVTTGSGKNRNRRTYYRKVVMIPCELKVHEVRIQKENFFNNIFNRDLKTEWEQFNEAWKLTGSDPRFVHALLDQQMQQWFMRHQAKNFMLGEGWLYIYTEGRLEYEELDHYLEIGREFRERVPAFVWHDYGMTPPPAR